MDAKDKAGVAATLLRAAWPSISLGLANEGALLLTALGFGEYEAAQPFVAGLAGKPFPVGSSLVLCAVNLLGNRVRLVADV